MVLHSKYFNKYFIMALKEHCIYHCLLCNMWIFFQSKV